MLQCKRKEFLAQRRGGLALIEKEYGNIRYMPFEQNKQFPVLIHGIFTRHGGYSQAPYESLNVSLSSGNERFEDAVRNRFRVLQSLNIADYPCATMWMIHGSQVLTLEGEDWPDWRPDWPHAVYHLHELGYPEGTKLQWTFKPRTKADAMITRKRGVALVISTADCVPLLFYDPVTEAIGVAHAGWRGTARGIGAATVCGYLRRDRPFHRFVLLRGFERGTATLSRSASLWRVANRRALSCTGGGIGGL